MTGTLPNTVKQRVNIVTQSRHLENQSGHNQGSRSFMEMRRTQGYTSLLYTFCFSYSDLKSMGSLSRDETLAFSHYLHFELESALKGNNLLL